MVIVIHPALNSGVVSVLLAQRSSQVLPSQLLELSPIPTWDFPFTECYLHSHNLVHTKALASRFAGQPSVCAKFVAIRGN